METLLFILALIISYKLAKIIFNPIESDSFRNYDED